MALDSRNTFHSLSPELKTEFYTSFKEAMDELENCFSILDTEFNNDVVHEMFRAVHSIKGNCHLVFLDEIADVCHKLEDIVSQIRNREYSYSPVCGEFFTVVFQRLEQLVRKLIKGGDLTDLEVQVLDASVAKVFEAKIEARDLVMHQMLDSLSGILSSSVDISAKILKKIQAQRPPDEFDEMAFMHQISSVMRNKSLRHSCDMDKLLFLAEALCRAGVHKVQFDQLRAAIYMSLLGSKFVTFPLFDILPESEAWERQRLTEQIEITSGFLKFGGNWFDAAAMIEHSFARYDGKGLPENVAGEMIHPGGMILSLLRFYQQEYRKALVENKKKLAAGKALRIMNSEKGYRFDPDYVDQFSRIAKEQPQLLFI